MAGNVLVGLQRFTIKDLVCDVNNVIVVGIIITKLKPRIFKNDNGVKAVWNCTIRDSPYDYINLTYWGSEEVIYPLYDKFQVGDIIEIIRPKIIIRKAQDVSERFEPNVTSPFKLILGEQSQITRHESDQCTLFYNLMHIPTKPLVTFIALNDVQNYNHVKDTYLNLLVAVRTICEPRHVRMRNGLEQQVRDVIVFDHTISEFKISIWDPELIARASIWKPRVTILFMVDMKVIWNNYFKRVTGTLTTKTIITENPVGYEAETLRKFAMIAPLQTSSILDKMTASLPNPSSIQNVMTIERIISKVNSIINAINLNADDQTFTVLVYAVVTELDLDGLSRVVTNKCGHCKKIFKSSSLICDDPLCPMGCGDERSEVETSFDIKVVLSDHTGSLPRCRLSGSAAESVLHCSVTEFLAMSDERKYRLKWKYLMERCAVRLLILCLNGRDPLVSIISCEVASPIEVANKIPLC